MKSLVAFDFHSTHDFVLLCFWTKKKITFYIYSQYYFGFCTLELIVFSIIMWPKFMLAIVPGKHILWTVKGVGPDMVSRSSSSACVCNKHISAEKMDGLGSSFDFLYTAKHQLTSTCNWLHLTWGCCYTDWHGREYHKMTWYVYSVPTRFLKVIHRTSTVAKKGHSCSFWVFNSL